MKTYPLLLKLIKLRFTVRRFLLT